uniref:PB1-like domain-containing protein n=1 Tax=Arundo donax TaxID=35708 RepID=A0A0A9HK09_ARUDO
MDDGDKLAIRFRYGGEFLFDGNKMHYVGGAEGISHIERDLISLPEIVDHLKDHGVDVEGILLHWLLPGKGLDNGLTVLNDDKVCQYMS